MIKIEQLTEVVWRFSRSNGDVISDSMILQSDGSIGGPGVVESRWRLSDGKLAIMMADGTVTTWFQVDQRESSASLRLVGEFELRRGHGMFHILEAVRSKDTLTDVAPATSSLPGGTRREAVHYPLRLVWRREFDDFLHARRIYTQFKFDEKGAYAVGEAVEIAAPCHVEAYANLPHRSFCTMGTFSYSISPLGPGTIVGRYCSLAFGISLMDHAHPVDRITTSPLTYDRSIAWFARSDFGGELDILDFAAVFPEPPVIGHDVWIGNGVLIGSGIKIGHGSIIGARSIVTRDVPPYSVVAGSPAIVRRMRFDDKTVERFLKQCWWDYAFYQLPSCWTDPVAFLDRLEEGVGRGIIHKLDARRYDVGLELSRLDALLRNQG